MPKKSKRVKPQAPQTQPQTPLPLDNGGYWPTQKEALEQQFGKEDAKKHSSYPKVPKEGT